MSNNPKHGDQVSAPVPPRARFPDTAQDTHREEEEYKRSVTVILWYEANATPIRISQTIPTFPYFKLSEITNLVAELRLTANTYLETYNPETAQWDQLRVSSVRKVESQQRLLYRIRKSLLEGLKDSECLHIEDELKIQRRFLKSFRGYSQCPASAASSAAKFRGEPSSPRCVCKRGSIDVDSDSESPIGRPPHKVHIPNDFYPTQQPFIHCRNDHLSADVDDNADSGAAAADVGTAADTGATAASSATATSTATTISGSISAANDPHAAAAQSLPTPPSSSSSNVSTDDFLYPGAIYDTHSTPATAAASAATPGGASSSSSAAAAAAAAAITTLSTSPSSIPIPISPYPPHPPLKRWPNDYTVAEISAGFNAMDSLVAQSANGSTMTHKSAFERVFGSRYVKSTVCRHRGVWKRAHTAVKAQYITMGHDDRAYWGEFVRHVEGRPSSLRNNSGSLSNPTPNASALVSHHGIPEEDEDPGQIDEAQCLKSLQNSQAMQTMDAYDPSLASLGT